MAPLLSIRDLTKTYAGGRGRAPVEALRGVSFEVQEGEFFGLLGPNGAGKSTTLGCISTLVRPSSGGIVVGGVDTVRDPVAARRLIAVVPQQRNLDRDLSCREVLTYHGRYFGLESRERESRADRLLAELSIADKAGAKPLTLSGGQQQRLMIARALMHDPKVVLLDEPTTGLDPQGRRLLWETLQRLNGSGITFILTTHYMEEADLLCRRVAIIDHGRILCLDSPDELKRGLTGGQVLDLTLHGGASLAERLTALAGVLGHESAGSRGGLLRLRLFVEPSRTLVDAVLTTVQQAGARLEQFSLTPPSLEDVYVHLTGRGLRE